MIFIANSRTNLAHAQTVDTRPFSFPPAPRKGTGYEARRETRPFRPRAGDVIHPVVGKGSCDSQTSQYPAGFSKNEKRALVDAKLKTITKWRWMPCFIALEVVVVGRKFLVSGIRRGKELLKFVMLFLEVYSYS